jgi:Transglycosylase SLT domain
MALHLLNYSMLGVVVMGKTFQHGWRLATSLLLVFFAGCAPGGFSTQDSLQHSDENENSLLDRLLSNDKTDHTDPELPENPATNPTATPAPSPTPTPTQSPATPLPLREIHGFWDDRSSHGSEWTKETVQSLKNYGQSLLQFVPPDIGNYCPRYAHFDEWGRINFWVMLISAVAAAESAFDPTSSYKENMIDRNGHFVISRGLLQISLESSKLYDCQMTTEEDLNDAARNIECGVKIMNRLVSADGVLSSIKNTKWAGAAKYWSTLRTTNHSSATIRKLISGSPLCQ